MRAQHCRCAHLSSSLTLLGYLLSSSYYLPGRIFDLAPTSVWSEITDVPVDPLPRLSPAPAACSRLLCTQTFSSQTIGLDSSTSFGFQANRTVTRVLEWWPSYFSIDRLCLFTRLEEERCTGVTRLKLACDSSAALPWSHVCRIR